MTKTVAFSSGDSVFSPEVQDLIDQTTELMKLDILQGLAFEQDPDVFKLQGVRKNPSKVGHLVAKRLKSLPKGGKRHRPDYGDKLPLDVLYDADMRQIARRHGVDLMSKKGVIKQLDLEQKFGYLRKSLTEKSLVSHQYEDLFTSEIDVDEVASDTRAAINTVLPIAKIDPVVARLLKDRLVDFGGVDLSGLIDNRDDDDSSDEADSAGSAATIQLNRGLKFRLHKVKCIQETAPAWPGSDEIAAGGVGVNWNKASSKIDEFQVGNSFDGGDVKVYSPPRVLKTFDLDGAGYPADFLVALALSEKDNGGMSAFVQELWEAIRDEVEMIMKAVGVAAGLAAGTAIGGATGTAIGGPLGTIIGVAAGAIIGALVGWLVGALKDDLFPPAEAGLRLTTHDSTFNGGSLTSQIMSLNFRGHGGYYRAYYSWQIRR